MKPIEKKHAILVTEFNRYVIEHHGFAKKLPRNAQIVLQIEGDEEYNTWSRKIAEKQGEKGQAAIYVHVKGLKPAHSRLMEPVVLVA